MTDVHYDAWNYPAVSDVRCRVHRTKALRAGYAQRVTVGPTAPRPSSAASDTRTGAASVSFHALPTVLWPDEGVEVSHQKGPILEAPASHSEAGGIQVESTTEFEVPSLLMSRGEELGNLVDQQRPVPGGKSRPGVTFYSVSDVRRQYHQQMKNLLLLASNQAASHKPASKMRAAFAMLPGIRCR